MDTNFNMKNIPSVIPVRHGLGLTSLTPLELDGYRYETVGRYHNYYFTRNNFEYPKIEIDTKYTVDGFSPNLNKNLHIGHLRNLALAISFNRIFYKSKPVSMLGASLGVKKEALVGLKSWLTFLNYHPNKYYDVLLPEDVIDISDGIGDQQGCKVWNGPNGPVIVVRSDGRKTYAYHDLVFAKEVSPDFYITGSEQKEHFESLGLGDKHLPMGLVLGLDGKKMKSRTGDSFSAKEALEAVIQNLEETSSPQELAWNILAWNFLSSSRESNIKFNPEHWSKTTSPGMYISYTYARLLSALINSKINFNDYYNDIPESVDLNEDDMKLLGFCSYSRYYRYRSILDRNTNLLASYVFDLAKMITLAYNRERIVNQREGFMWTMTRALNTLGDEMYNLGMFPMSEV